MTSAGMKWQPVGDCLLEKVNGSQMRRSDGGNRIRQVDDLFKTDVTVFLPDDLRLCTLVPDEGGVPSEVVEAIATWIDGGALPYGLSDDEQDYFMSQQRIAREWLTQQQKGGE